MLPVTAEGTPLFTQRGAGRRAGTRGRSCGSTTRRSRSRTASTRSRSARGESFLERYGGRISSEWYFPKLIELWLEDREVYDACHGFIEATDWIVWYLTGNERRHSCTAGYKAMWSQEEGLPSAEYFEAAYPGFTRPRRSSARSSRRSARARAPLRAELAARLGLPEQRRRRGRQRRLVRLGPGRRGRVSRERS